MFYKHFKLIELSPQLNIVYSYRFLVLYNIMYSVSLYAIPEVMGVLVFAYFDTYIMHH